mmetsp:Transcript_68090/g.197316  ORF Transcript_68090/g.197316 Transcript_68090/m.197316 type:complete len:305 (+) Transcript_68090:586-1500(+)
MQLPGAVRGAHAAHLPLLLQEVRILVPQGCDVQPALLLHHLLVEVLPYRGVLGLRLLQACPAFCEFCARVNNRLLVLSTSPLAILFDRRFRLLGIAGADLRQLFPECDEPLAELRNRPNQLGLRRGRNPEGLLEGLAVDLAAAQAQHAELLEARLHLALRALALAAMKPVLEAGAVVDMATLKSTDILLLERIEADGALGSALLVDAWARPHRRYTDAQLRRIQHAGHVVRRLRRRLTAWRCARYGDLRRHLHCGLRDSCGRRKRGDADGSELYDDIVVVVFQGRHRAREQPTHATRCSRARAT